MRTTSIQIKPMTLQELANLYSVSKRIMRNWVNARRGEIGKRVGHFFNIRQVTVIFNHYGHPAVRWKPKQLPEE